MNIARLFKHFLIPPWLPVRRFTPALRAEIATAVAASEVRHRGEIVFAVEGPLPWRALWRDQTPRARATELFARLRVWDTEENSGILIYLQLVDRDVEIIADRGIAAKVPLEDWQALCEELKTALRSDNYRAGALAAIATASRLLEAHFPVTGKNPNELPDALVVV